MTAVLPGATIGVVGGGQLGRMLGLEARRLGYRFAVLDPEPDAPAAQIADLRLCAPWDDEAAGAALARACDVVTVETEHVPAAALARIEEVVPLRPGAAVFGAVQDRLLQRELLARVGAPQAPFAGVSDERELAAAIARIGLPAILKRRRGGYDGRGQVRIEGRRDAEGALRRLGGAPATLEPVVPFEREISVLLARARDGARAVYPIAENVHRAQTLRETRAPARLSPAEQAAAEALAGRVADALGHVGVLALELFVCEGGRLLVNEIAPRVHNSGHFTLGACVTSQFEQHLRAICDLPLGDPSLVAPALMVNLYGDLWARGAPDFRPLLGRKDARLHLYGKREPRPGRKMGHVLLLGGPGGPPPDASTAVLAALGAQP